ncbi:dehydratase [Skermania sp. ID1734]|uniref:MaoC/PaaZ C-terminal domain-containing protein n=1 Tax=Skermania sp. ID1734 TaxID=2597516 RepID=UPI00117CFB5A|nr:MaoC/PaaZ C-terminal domain-containing protein [Skermania sp. ID1734]TSE01591.1 dehydratase [Skermania sp. ID1734]
MSRALQVGQELEALTPGPVTRTQLALFAGASGDHNPIHIDLDFARAAGMEDVIAHGMLSMAYVGRMLTDAVPIGNLLEWEVRFVAITPVHARPTCRGTVTAIEDDIATIDVRVVLEDGTTTLTGTAKVLVA